MGSDEAIDALIRCFCRPGRDKILTCPPTYGMYAVSAQVNDVEVVKVPLDRQDFSLRASAIDEALARDPTIKLVLVTSPGNPTGNLVSRTALHQILRHPTWNGVVVVDEAYIDFAAADDDGDEEKSLARDVLSWPNLVVMQTLSKAFGLAAIRLGAAFASPPVARLLNNIKAPYNISTPTSVLARAALSPSRIEVMRQHRRSIALQRARLLRELPTIPGVGRFLGGQDSNFLLVEILDSPHPQERDGTRGKADNSVALAVYEELAGKRGVVVRFRGREYGCHGCLRITVGTESEVSRFLKELSSVLKMIYSRVLHQQVERDEGEKEGRKGRWPVQDGTSGAGKEEDQRRAEMAANDVVS